MIEERCYMYIKWHGYEIESIYLKVINRIYDWFSVQTENSQPEGKRTMPETSFTEFPAFSVDPEGRDFSVCLGDRWLIIFFSFMYLLLEKIENIVTIFLLFP